MALPYPKTLAKHRKYDLYLSLQGKTHRFNDEIIDAEIDEGGPQFKRVRKNFENDVGWKTLGK